MSIHYKFKSSVKYMTIPVKGRSMGCVDLKIAIVQANRLEKGMDFDLIVTNEDTEEEYNDDAFVSKNTRVIVRRAPPKPGGGILEKIERNKTITEKETLVTIGPSYYHNDGAGFEELERPKIRIGSEFTNIDPPTTVTTTAKKKWDPRMMDDSSDEESGDNSDTYNPDASDEEVGGEENMMDILKRQKEEEEMKIKQLAESAERRRIMEADAARRAAEIAKRKQRGPRRFTDRKEAEVAKDTTSKEPEASDVWGGLATVKPAAMDEGSDATSQEFVPEQFRCALTKKMLVDAVVLPCCGQTCSKEPVKAAMKPSENGHVCPVCGAEDIKRSSLKPNRIVRGALQKYLMAKENNDEEVLKSFVNVDSSGAGEGGEGSLGEEDGLTIRKAADGADRIEAPDTKKDTVPTTPVSTIPPKSPMVEANGVETKKDVAKSSPAGEQSAMSYGGYGAPPPVSYLGGYGAPPPGPPPAITAREGDRGGSRGYNGSGPSRSPSHGGSKSYKEDHRGRRGDGGWGSNPSRSPSQMDEHVRPHRGHVHGQSDRMWGGDRSVDLKRSRSPSHSQGRANLSTRRSPSSSGGGWDNIQNHDSKRSRSPSHSREKSENSGSFFRQGPPKRARWEDNRGGQKRWDDSIRGGNKRWERSDDGKRRWEERDEERRLDDENGGRSGGRRRRRPRGGRKNRRGGGQ